MRNPNRIQKLLNMIFQYWSAKPDLKLCQIILNLTTVNGWNPNDLRDLEDSDLIKMFNGRYAPKDSKSITYDNFE